MTPQPVDSKFNPVTTNLPSSEDIPQIGVIDNSRGNLQNIDLSNGGQVLVPVDERTFNPVEESKPIYFTYPKDSSNDVPEDIKNIPGLSTVYIVSPPGAPDEFLVLVVIKPTESFTVPEKGTPYIPLNDTSSTLPKLNEEKTVFVVIPKYTTVTYEVCEEITTATPSTQFTTEATTTGATTPGTTTSGRTGVTTTGATTLVTTGGTTSGTTGPTTSGTTGPTTSGSTLTTAGPCGVSMTPQPVDSKFNPVTTNLPSSEDIPQIGVIDNSRGNLQNIDLSNGGQVLVPVDERTFNPVEESKPIYFTYPKDSSNDVPEDIKNIPGLSTVYIVSPPGAPDEFLVLVVIKPTESFTVPEKGTPYIPLNDTSSTLPKLNEEKTVFVVIPKYTTVTYEVCEGTTGATTSGTTGPITSGSTLTTAGPCGVSMTPQPVNSKFNPVTTNLPSSEDIPQIGVIDNSRGKLQNIDLSNGGQVLVPVDERTFNPVEESKPIYFTYPKDSSNDVPEDIKNIPGLSTVYIVSPPGAPDEFLVLVVIKPSESFTVPEKGTPYIPLNDTSSTLPKLNEEKTVFVVIPKYTTVTYEVCEEQPPGSESTSVSQSTPAQPTETETTSPTVTLPVGSSTSSAPTVSVTETVSETTVPSTSGTTTSGRTGATTTGATTLVTTGGTTSGTTGATTSGTTGPTTSGSTLTTAGPCGVSMTPQPVDSKFNPVTTNLPSSEDIPQIGVIDNSRGNLQNIDLSNGGQVLVPVDERTFNPVEESKPIYFTYPKDSSNDVPEDIKNIPGLSTVYIVSPPGAPDEFLVLVVIKPTESFTVPEKGTPYIPLNDTSSTLPKLNEEKTVFVVIPKYTTVTYEVCEGTTGATTSGTTGPITSGSTLTTAGPCGVSMTPQPVNSKFNPVTTNLPSSEDIPQIGVIDNSRGKLQNIDLSNGGQVLVPVDERTFNPVEESKPIYFTYPKDSSNDVPEDIKNIPGLSTVYIVSPPGAPDEFLVLVVIKPSESFTVPEKGTPYIPLVRICLVIGY
ncbi:SCO-spondin [Biomphalaria glabrata]|nr:SCO-spondin [Biomphalaria glabrata]